MLNAPLLDLIRLWALSLMLSAVLVAAGERWPQPLAVRTPLVAALVLLPVAAVLVWLAWNWSIPEGGSADRGESHHSEASEF